MQVSGVIHLGDDTYNITRHRLGGFLALQKANEETAKAATINDGGGIARGIFTALRISIDLELETFNVLPWQDIIAAYIQLDAINQIPEKEQYAILGSKGGGDESPWHYPGRFGILIVHLLASNYNWSKTEIENLWPEEAFAYIQEIIADEHDRREFAWLASPVAYPYDKASKKNKFIKLPKPAWMVGLTGELKPNKLGRVPEAMRPKGHVIESPERERLEREEWLKKNR